MSWVPNETTAPRYRVPVPDKKVVANAPQKEDTPRRKQTDGTAHSALLLMLLLLLPLK